MESSAEHFKIKGMGNQEERATSNMNQHAKMSTSDLGASPNNVASMDCLIMPQPDVTKDRVVDKLKFGSILVNDYAEYD